MIAITGATGQLGQLVMNSLMQKTDPANIIALARNPDALTDVEHAGFTVRQADYIQPVTLKTALEGARKVLLISGSEVGQRVTQHQAVT